MPPGSTSSRPNVARAPASVASWREASTVAAYACIGSWRSCISVAPAWLASPQKSSRQRPCGQIAVATPTAAPAWISDRPCSTCSSTNVPMLSRRSVRPTLRGSRPRAVMTSAIVRPSRSLRARALSALSAPVTSCEPAHAMPNRAPSSSAKLPTTTGRLGVNPSARSRSTAANDETTPSGPSYAPPSGTESRCEPISSASVAAAPPGELVAVAVLDELHAARRRLAGEPLAQLHVGIGPREPPIAAGPRIPPDGSDVVKHQPLPSERVASAPPSIGTRRPRSLATSAARS